MPRTPHPSVAIAVLVATLVGGALLLSGTVWPDEAVAADADAGQTVPGAEAARVPAVAYDFHPTRTFAVEGDGSVALTVPASSMAASLSVWFEGAMTGGGAVRIFDPDGALVLETVVDDFNAAVGGRNNEKSIGAFPLQPGEWRVEFSGGPGATGHAHIRTE